MVVKRLPDPEGDRVKIGMTGILAVQVLRRDRERGGVGQKPRFRLSLDPPAA